ncbi:MAG: zinc-ribbon domain-containing protein [Candidatus Hermodarchaeota archaeon]
MCQTCGMRIYDGANFCTNCGERVASKNFP